MTTMETTKKLQSILNQIDTLDKREKDVLTSLLFCTRRGFGMVDSVESSACNIYDQDRLDPDSKEDAIMMYELDNSCVKYMVTRFYIFEYLKEKGEEEKIIELIKSCKDYRGLKYLDNQPEDLCIEAIEYAGRCHEQYCYLDLIKNQTEAICLAAIKANPHMIKEIKNPTEEMILYALNKDPHIIMDIEQTEERCRVAFDSDKRCICYIKNPSDEMCIEAINEDIELLITIANPSEKVCLRAIEIDPESAIWIPKSYFTKKIADALIDNGWIDLASKVIPDDLVTLEMIIKSLKSKSRNRTALFDKFENLWTYEMCQELFKSGANIGYLYLMGDDLVDEDMILLALKNTSETVEIITDLHTHNIMTPAISEYLKKHHIRYKLV